MSLVTTKLNEGTLTFFVSGKIDSTNAPQVEAEVNEAKAGSTYEKVVLDMDDLEYISSAGLRVILRLRQSEPTLTIVNAQPAVYDILEMTGFVEMIPTGKALRRVSVEGCELIGQGANGKVYRIDPETIIKVYMNPDALPDIERERDLAKKAFVKNIPTAIPFDVVRVGDGYGSVFELLNAKSFAKILAAEPDRVEEIIDLYIDLLKKIHATEVEPGDMPDMREVALKWATFLKDYLPEEYANKLVALVEAVPVDHHMMHGDYHIKNVMLQDGEALLIDMDTLCQGHPVFELASMFNAYCGFSELDHSVSAHFLGVPHSLSVVIWEKALPKYLGTDDEDYIAAVKDKAMLIGYTRLMRRLIRRNGLESEQGRKEIECYKNHIIDLLQKVDTLVF